jgi:hypothetical protein
MATVIVHDRRLLGATPLNYNYVKTVGPGVSIASVIGSVAHYGASKPLDILHILCHGYESHVNLADQSSVPGAVGGFGLQLCAEGLTLYNATLTARWRGRVNRIVVFACAPADTGRGNEGTRGDGRRLCGELALWSGAEVIAARDTQYYNTVPAHYGGSRTVGNTIDFGAWEGPVYSFTPDVPGGTVINPAAYNMANPAVM